MSIFKPKYNVYDEIDKLHLELRGIEETKEFVNTGAWAKIKDVFLSRIMSYDESIIKLCKNTKKNKDEIEGKYSLRTAYKDLIEGFETTLTVDTMIREKLKQLEEIAELAELER